MSGGWEAGQQQRGSGTLGHRDRRQRLESTAVEAHRTQRLAENGVMAPVARRKALPPRTRWRRGSKSRKAAVVTTRARLRDGRSAFDSRADGHRQGGQSWCEEEAGRSRQDVRGERKRVRIAGHAGGGHQRTGRALTRRAWPWCSSTSSRRLREANESEISAADPLRYRRRRDAHSSSLPSRM